MTTHRRPLVRNTTAVCARPPIPMGIQSSNSKIPGSAGATNLGSFDDSAAPRTGYQRCGRDGSPGHAASAQPSAVQQPAAEGAHGADPVAPAEGSQRIYNKRPACG